MNNSFISHFQESTCHYLFRKEVSEIYQSSKFSEDFINQCLETLIRVNIAFLSRKGKDGFPFIDPVACNNQCHLYSLFTSKIMKTYKEKSQSEKLAKTEENRFLHLSFLLSYSFLTDRTLLCKAIEISSNKEEIALPSNKKLFFDFTKDTGGTLIRSARLSLNEMFEQCMKDALAASKERSLLHKEIYQLSLENLYLASGGKTKLSLYTFPKIAGVAYLINEMVPFVIKTKVITSKGNGTLFYQSPFIKKDEPVLVFEAIASAEFSVDQFRKIAEQCPSYFERKPSKKSRHVESETCFFCNPNSIDVKPYQKRFDKATESIQETLYALGADFTQEVQTPFLKFFSNTLKYPILTDVFQKAVTNIDQLGVSMKKPLAFTVEHVYADYAAQALSSEFRMNSSPEEYLKERGFL